MQPLPRPGVPHGHGRDALRSVAIGPIDRFIELLKVKLAAIRATDEPVAEVGILHIRLYGVEGTREIQMKEICGVEQVATLTTRNREHMCDGYRIRKTAKRFDPAQG